VRVRFATAHERVGRLNVYRRAQVSWYGPGLYGGRLGCGGTLTPGTLGVASKALPCGAKVTLRHGGRTLRVPVVDRGPYSGAREFDLTAATKARLGFSGVGTILVAD
jgi:rare lipoprotein A